MAVAVLPLVAVLPASKAILLPAIVAEVTAEPDSLQTSSVVQTLITQLDVDVEVEEGNVLLMLLEELELDDVVELLLLLVELLLLLVELLLLLELLLEELELEDEDELLLLELELLEEELELNNSDELELELLLHVLTVLQTST